MPVVDLLPRREELRIAALNRFGRTIESVKVDVECIKEWAKKQHHFPEIPSDNHITSFLILSKFEFAKAKRMIDTYYTVAGIMPEIFKDPEAPDVLEVTEVSYWFPLPKVTPANCRIILCKVRKKAGNQPFDPEAFITSVTSILDILFREDVGAPNIFFLDGANVQLEHITSFSPTMVKRLCHMTESLYSNQIHQMHFFNVPALMEPLLALVKTFMKPKIAERIHYHNNVKTLLEYLPKECMPCDYGGEEESLETLHQLWKEKVKEEVPMIRHRNQLKTDESKRHEESSLDSELLGLEGNFRKLDVD